MNAQNCENDISKNVRIRIRTLSNLCDGAFLRKKWKTKSRIWWDFRFDYLSDYGWEVAFLINIICFRCLFGSMCCGYCCYCTGKLPCWNSIPESLEDGPCKRSNFHQRSGRKSYVLKFAFLTVLVPCINTSFANVFMRSSLTSCK